MNDPEDRILDLALEELYGSRDDARPAATLDRVEQRLAESGRGRRVAAVAASLLSLAVASWFVLGGFDRTPEAGRPVPGVFQDPSSDGDLKRLIEQLSDPDAAVRDRASAALKRKGPDLLGRLREDLSRAKDAETRSRLQDLITYWTRAVAARVGGEILTWDDVNAGLKDIRPSDITEELRRSILRGLVEERIFLQEVRRRKILVPEEELRGTPEGEREKQRLRLSIQKLYDRILEDARVNPGADPFKLDLGETAREELRRWYDAHPDKFAAVDRVDLCWVELPFAGEVERTARKTLGDAIVAKMRTKNNLGWACTEMGLQTNIHIGNLERGVPGSEPFSEETKKLILDDFKFGEARVIDDNKSAIVVVQLYDRRRRVSETFEKAEPAIRAMFENQRLEENRRRVRDALLKQARITPEDLFNNR